MSFDKYSKEVEEIANLINLKKSISTERTGAASVRDKIVFGKLAWQESLSFVAIIQSAIIFTALIPDSVGTINGFLLWLGISYQFPVEIASVSAIVFVIIVFAFGFIAVRHIGTVKRVNEITTKMNPAIYLLWTKLEALEKKIDDKK